MLLIAWTIMWMAPLVKKALDKIGEYKQQKEFITYEVTATLQAGTMKKPVHTILVIPKTDKYTKTELMVYAETKLMTEYKPLMHEHYISFKDIQVGGPENE